VLLTFNDGATVLRGSDGLRKYLVDVFGASGSLNPDVASTHLMANVLVEVNGDRGRAETTAVTYRVGDGIVVTRGILYSDECAKIAGRWVIVRRAHRATWQTRRQARPCREGAVSRRASGIAHLGLFRFVRRMAGQSST